MRGDAARGAETDGPAPAPEAAFDVAPELFGTGAEAERRPVADDTAK